MLRLVIASALAACLSGCSCPLPFVGNTNALRDVSAQIASARQWAIKIDMPGLPNLHRVSGHLYRGAQPTRQGMRRLPALGVRTVINLRPFHSDAKDLKGTGMDYVHIPTFTWSLGDRQAVRFLEIVTDPDRTPVFIHCKHGADRAGTMCAVYRIVVQNWTKDQAIAEMTKGGFHFHSTWQNLPRYIRKLDIDKLKRRAGTK